ncbi:unnamed protein product [Urochloa humidicola]
MAGQSPLRRWKPFFAAFGLVDAAIEAAGPALCRDKIRSARGEVVELLCGVPAGDARKAEELCVVLDGFMAESLLTLLAVPTEAVPSMLASSADLPKAIGALRLHHQSARVRGLACDAAHGVNNKKAASRRPDVKRGDPEKEEERMEATKRKLREGYREAEDAKRQRKIQVIAAPKMAEQRQRKMMHPILRERSRARCGASTAVVRRSLVSSFNRA